MQNEYSTKIHKKAPKKIIVLDFERSLSNRVKAILKNDPILKSYSLFSFTSIDLFIQKIKSDVPSIVITVEDENYKYFSLMQTLNQFSPNSVKLAFAKRWNNESLFYAVNFGKVFRALNSDADEFEMRHHLLDAEEESNFLESHKDLKKIFAEQNKSLEILNSDLEQMVNEKTNDIQISKDEIDLKVQRLRQLTTFIKDLSHHILFDEIMSLISKEVRKFAHVNSPYLILQSLKSHIQIFGYANSQSNKVELVKNYEFTNEINTNDKYTAAFLANALSRPVAKLISIPLEISQIQKFGLTTACATLCIEHSMNDFEIDKFISHLLDRVRPLSMAVDRAFLQKELMSQYFRWEKTFDGIKDPVAIIDYQFSLIRANKKFSDKVIQKKCYQEFAHRQTPCEGCPLEKALKYGQHKSGQININGRVIEVNSYPIKDSFQNRFTTVINQYIDVTDSKELYARMLQNEKMSGIGMLAGNIAHELNNPLTGIRSLSQILIQQTNEEPQLQGDLKEIEKASARSQKIIKNLLDFSIGQTQEEQIVSIDEIVDRTMPMLKTVMRHHRLKLSLETANLLVKAEPHLLQQVVFNLINNACQAMEDNGTLKVISRSSAETGFVELLIEDTGPGIPKELFEKIFEPFFTTKKEGQGTGLGLSLSRDIVKRIGGDIFLISQLNVGSQFLIKLPIHSRK